jgi:hypothetical protein
VGDARHRLRLLRAHRPRRRAARLAPPRGRRAGLPARRGGDHRSVARARAEARRADHDSTREGRLLGYRAGAGRPERLAAPRMADEGGDRRVLRAARGACSRRTPTSLPRSASTICARWRTRSRWRKSSRSHPAPSRCRCSTAWRSPSGGGSCSASGPRVRAGRRAVARMAYPAAPAREHRERSLRLSHHERVDVATAAAPEASVASSRGGRPALRMQRGDSRCRGRLPTIHG